ncbi:unnamed protein product [Nesidiocoris tenuis]|uniref:Uncharacterized protein n=1 Tax=Nesidiocoris tenuis TaxID=355587 RepID=A0A6H5GJ50_9HEMI|nr:unnamed protein product [Nesidiocoris tenuis]
MEFKSETVAVHLPHHEQQELCDSRPAYRQGRKLTAVKVYTVNNESQHLLIYRVPAINLENEVMTLCERFGQVTSLRKLVSNHPNDEVFTDIYHVQYGKIRQASKCNRVLHNLGDRLVIGKYKMADGFRMSFDVCDKTRLFLGLGLLIFQVKYESQGWSLRSGPGAGKSAEDRFEEKETPSSPSSFSFFVFHLFHPSSHIRRHIAITNSATAHVICSSVVFLERWALRTRRDDGRRSV